MNEIDTLRADLARVTAERAMPQTTVYVLLADRHESEFLGVFSTVVDAQAYAERLLGTHQGPMQWEPGTNDTASIGTSVDVEYPDSIVYEWFIHTETIDHPCQPWLAATAPLEGE